MSDLRSMKLGRRGFLLATAAVMATPLGAACAPAAPATVQAPEPTRPAAATPAPAATAASAQATATLTIAFPANPPLGPKWHNEVVIPEFKKAFPNVALDMQL